jgi:hypothetical protein
MAHGSSVRQVYRTRNTYERVARGGQEGETKGRTSVAKWDAGMSRANLGWFPPYSHSFP